jgi:hypothetical protein
MAHSIMRTLPKRTLWQQYHPLHHHLCYFCVNLNYNCKSQNSPLAPKSLTLRKTSYELGEGLYAEIPWCFIDWSQKGALAEAVPAPSVFVHEVPCPEAAAAKPTTRPKTTGKMLDGIIDK